jgi:hypothetical protein
MLHFGIIPRRNAIYPSSKKVFAVHMIHTRPNCELEKFDSPSFIFESFHA